MSGNSTLYRLFASSSAARPDNVALVVDGVSLTYAGLRDLACGIAAGVAALNPESARIGLYARPHALTYAGYLAILRLGAVVVPLDPDAPMQRVRDMADAAGLTTVLSAGPVPPEKRPGGVRIIDLLSPSLPRPERTLPPVPDDVDETAYLLFTSGSTGRPKGVPITHRSALAYVEFAAERYQVTADSRLSQTFDLTFDPSVFDLFAGWSAGAAVVKPDRRDLLMPARFVTAHDITHWFSVPSVVSVAARLGAIPAGSMPGLRCSQFIGEQLTLQQAEAWHRGAPGSHLENVYGPTELTVACAEYRLPQAVADWPATSNGTVPIGAIYRHLEHLVLGEDGTPAAEGELCVRGNQRFAGYLADQDNAGRFLSYEPGGRARTYDGTEELTADHWYRTGDRVRVEHGTLVHHGRYDFQVKVRGYRIELGEIEAALRSHAAVQDAVVVAVDRGDGLTEIRAVLSGRETRAGALDAHLAGRLPQYMMPQAYFLVPEMPLGGNGKLDRRRIAQIAAGVDGGPRRLPR